METADKFGKKPLTILHETVINYTSMLQATEKIWVDGKLVLWNDAKVHVLAHTLHYGTGVFEGIRCYKTDTLGSAVFRLKEHVDRLFDSMHILQMECPFTREQVSE